MLNQINFSLPSVLFKPFRVLPFPQPPGPERITLKWKGPWITEESDSPAPSAPHTGEATWGPTALQSRAELGLNPRQVDPGPKSTELHRLFISSLGIRPTRRKHGYAGCKVL